MYLSPLKALIFPSIDDSSPVEVALYNATPCYQVEIPIARGSAYGTHRVRILVEENAKGNATTAIDGFIVRHQVRRLDGYILSGIVIAGLVLGVTYLTMCFLKKP